MSGCQNCACGAKEEVKVCPPNGGAVTLDANGKCPCGKSLDECCHKDEIGAVENPAIGELCEPVSGKSVC